MPLPRLFVSFDADLDWLTCLEFGLVDDGQPSERWRVLAEWFGYYETADGRVAGFKIPAVSDIDLDDPDVAEMWDGPRFDVPLLGLDDVPAAEIVIAALAHFDGVNSLNRQLFDAAAGQSGALAAVAWRQCLESGDAMAHFGLGCALLEDARPHRAYRHLRHYATTPTSRPPTRGTGAGTGRRPKPSVRSAGRARPTVALELDDEHEPETDAVERLDAPG